MLQKKHYMGKRIKFHMLNPQPIFISESHKSLTLVFRDCSAQILYLDIFFFHAKHHAMNGHGWEGGEQKSSMLF